MGYASDMKSMIENSKKIKRVEKIDIQLEIKELKKDIANLTKKVEILEKK